MFSQQDLDNKKRRERETNMQRVLVSLKTRCEQMLEAIPEQDNSDIKLFRKDLKDCVDALVRLQSTNVEEAEPEVIAIDRKILHLQGQADDLVKKANPAAASSSASKNIKPGLRTFFRNGKPAENLETIDVHEEVTKANAETVAKGKIVKTAYSLLHTNNIGLAEDQGNRPTEEDRMVVGNLPEVPGADIPDNVFKETLNETVIELVSQVSTNVNEANKAGSCLLASIVVGNQVYTANLGDSQGYIVKVSATNEVTAEPIAIRHKPNLPSESEYIKQKGGTVIRGRINGRLGVARALGDGDYGNLVRREADIFPDQNKPSRVDFNPDNNEKAFVVLGCDGLSDHLEKEDIAQIIKDNPGKSTVELAEILVKKANEANDAVNAENADNVSVIVIQIDPKDPTPKYAGVFDGHGLIGIGDKVSDYAYQKFPEILKNKFENSLQNLAKQYEESHEYIKARKIYSKLSLPQEVKRVDQAFESHISRTILALTEPGESTAEKFFTAASEIHKKAMTKSPHDLDLLLEARFYYQAATKLGHVKAKYSLAVFHSQGLGDLKQDPDKAFRLFEEAANGGYARAQNKLAALYLAQQNLPEAKKWSQRVLDNKGPDADKIRSDAENRLKNILVMERNKLDDILVMERIKNLLPNAQIKIELKDGEFVIKTEKDNQALSAGLIKIGCEHVLGGDSATYYIDKDELKAKIINDESYNQVKEFINGLVASANLEDKLIAEVKSFIAEFDPNSLSKLQPNIIKEKQTNIDSLLARLDQVDNLKAFDDNGEQITIKEAKKFLQEAGEFHALALRQSQTREAAQAVFAINIDTLTTLGSLLEPLSKEKQARAFLSGDKDTFAYKDENDASVNMGKIADQCNAIQEQALLVLAKANPDIKLDANPTSSQIISAIKKEILRQVENADMKELVQNLEGAYNNFLGAVKKETDARNIAQNARKNEEKTFKDYPQDEVKIANAISVTDSANKDLATARNQTNEAFQTALDLIDDSREINLNDNDAMDEIKKLLDYYTEQTTALGEAQEAIRKKDNEKNAPIMKNRTLQEALAKADAAAANIKRDTEAKNDAVKKAVEKRTELLAAIQNNSANPANIQALISEVAEKNRLANAAIATLTATRQQINRDEPRGKVWELDPSVDFDSRPNYDYLRENVPDDIAFTKENDLEAATQQVVEVHSKKWQEQQARKEAVEARSKESAAYTKVMESHKALEVATADKNSPAATLDDLKSTLQLNENSLAELTEAAKAAEDNVAKLALELNNAAVAAPNSVGDIQKPNLDDLKKQRVLDDAATAIRNLQRERFKLDTANQTYTKAESDLKAATAAYKALPANADNATTITSAEKKTTAEQIFNAAKTTQASAARNVTQAEVNAKAAIKKVTEANIQPTNIDGYKEYLESSALAEKTQKEEARTQLTTTFADDYKAVMDLKKSERDLWKKYSKETRTVPLIELLMRKYSPETSPDANRAIVQNILRDKKALEDAIAGLKLNILNTSGSEKVFWETIGCMADSLQTYMNTLPSHQTGVAYYAEEATTVKNSEVKSEFKKLKDKVLGVETDEEDILKQDNVGSASSGHANKTTKLRGDDESIIRVSKDGANGYKGSITSSKDGVTRTEYYLDPNAKARLSQLKDEGTLFNKIPHREVLANAREFVQAHLGDNRLSPITPRNPLVLKLHDMPENLARAIVLVCVHKYGLDNINMLDVRHPTISAEDVKVSQVNKYKEKLDKGELPSLSDPKEEKLVNEMAERASTIPRHGRNGGG